MFVVASPPFDLWILFGFIAQFMFMMRFVVQWLARAPGAASCRSPSGVAK